MNATDFTHDKLQGACPRIFRQLEQMVRSECAERRFEQLADVESLLHCLPLDSSEFALAQNRVRNARRYFRAREVGAARFELRFLLNSLRCWRVEQAGVEPRRRSRQSNLG